MWEAGGEASKVNNCEYGSMVGKLEKLSTVSRGEWSKGREVPNFELGEGGKLQKSSTEK